MKDYHLTVLVIGFGLAYGILHLVRRDHLYIRQGLFWIAIALLTLAFAIWPYLIDTLGAALGIAYPPTLLFLVAIVVLVVKSLLGDIAQTKLRRDVRRLNQRIALIEAEHPIAHGRETETPQDQAESTVRESARESAG
ncbi:MAG TPA: DUF2304 domain-containing protein [Usitatibacter sp.]|nr:DUF2304 domain-containing protein [Usitatibacter sp.]